jgi:hypothetical protein
MDRSSLLVLLLAVLAAGLCAAQHPQHVPNNRHQGARWACAVRWGWMVVCWTPLHPVALLHVC